MATRPAFPQFVASFPVMGVNGSLVGVTKFESDPSLAGAKGNVLAKPGTFVGLTPKGEHQIRGQAFGGYIHAKKRTHTGLRGGC
jgi:D-alanyl-D-alanine carboxypeptidase